MFQFSARVNSLCGLFNIRASTYGTRIAQRQSIAILACLLSSADKAWNHEKTIVPLIVLSSIVFLRSFTVNCIQLFVCVSDLANLFFRRLVID